MLPWLPIEELWLLIEEDASDLSEDDLADLLSDFEPLDLVLALGVADLLLPFFFSVEEPLMSEEEPFLELVEEEAVVLPLMPELAVVAPVLLVSALLFLSEEPVLPLLKPEAPVKDVELLLAVGVLLPDALFPEVLFPELLFMSEEVPDCWFFAFSFIAVFLVR